jgi:signal peptidase II
MSERSATGRRTIELVVLLGTGAVLLLADQLSKAIVAANLRVGERVDVIGNVVQIWHAENSGAAFSLLQNLLPLFLLVSVLALGLIAYFAVSLRGRSLWLYFLLGGILGGTLGNLVDRVTHGGRVTDFVSVGVGDVRFPTFNVADSSLVVGILAVIVFLAFVDRTEDPGGGGTDAGRRRAQPGERVDDPADSARG